MTRLRVFKIVTVIILVIALASVFLLGVYAGYVNRPEVQKVTALINKETSEPNQVDFSPFWKAWNIIDEKYMASNGVATSTKPITSRDKVLGAIGGLVASLGDPYTVFLPPKEKKRFEDNISGNFSGVGMEMGIKNDTLTVIAPLSGTPAKRAGIEAGDKILKIDDTPTAGMNPDEAVGLIRGEKGKPVRFTLERGNQKPFEVTVIRDTITIPTIDSKKLPSGVFLISLYNFSAVSPDLFRNTLRQFVESGNDKLIIDLRGNPGGYLEAAVDMASWFLPLGKPVVIEKSSSGSNDKIYRSRGYDIFNDNLRMVILVDEGSASASEILAGALSEYGKATLIGEKTFGKGSVQELVPLTDDSSIKITIAKWYTPQGRSISQNGLEPKIIVPVTEENTAKGQDPQLDAAVKFLLSK